MKSDGHRDYDGAEWDASLQRLGGDLLQSWRWGEFKQRHGWSVERVQVSGQSGEGMAQVLFRYRGGLTLAYVPRGPVIAGGDAVAADLLNAIDELCVRRRAVVLVIEPNQALPPAWTGLGGGFSSGPAPFQAPYTVKVPLVPDADLLAQMRRDTRYNILHAQRNDIVVERAPFESSEIQTFYRMLRETSRRSGFRIHPRSYYEDFLQVFDQQAVLLFSRVDGVVTSGLVAAWAGDEGRSMYAGSATGHRARGDTALLRFEAMRWARDQGCTVFDLGGISSPPPPMATDQEDDDTGSGQGSSLGGVRRFKIGFGGEIIAFPGTVERRYRPGLAWVVRRFHSRFRTASPG